MEDGKPGMYPVGTCIDNCKQKVINYTFVKVNYHLDNVGTKHAQPCIFFRRYALE